MIRRNLSEKRRMRIVKQMAAVTMAVSMTVLQCAVGVADISYANVESSEELNKSDEGNYTYYEYIDGTVAIIEYNGEEENVTVPDKIGGKTVSSIGSECFKGNKNIKTVKLPDAITSIEFEAFEDCANLTIVSLPKKLQSIGGWSFEDCNNLKSIDFPESLESIGKQAFSKCSSLTDIYIPKNVTNIDSEAFLECSGLESIKVDKENEIYDSRENCNAIILTKDQYKYTGHTTVMVGCKNTVIPNSAEYIGEKAFFGCRDLKSINFPYSLKRIYAEAFSGCSSLTGISFPDSLEDIYAEAFSGCSSLTSIYIPKNVKMICESVFSGCSNLESIRVNPDNEIYDSREDCNAIIAKENAEDYEGRVTVVSGCKNTVIPNTVVGIGTNAFSGCDGLEEIRLPERVNFIANGAFSNCINLKSVIFPDSLLQIMDNVFSGCSRLTSIYIPRNVGMVGEANFSECSALTSIIVDSENDTFDSRDNCNAIVRTRDNTLIAGCDNTVIPNGISAIGEKAFSGCSGLKEITIPEGVLEIWDGTFSDCSSLKSIQLPDSVKHIGTDVFRGCSSLESLEIPPLVKDLYGSFEGCVNLKSIYIPRSVTWIYAGTFGGNAKVMCWMGSKAEEYAKENNIPYELLKTPEEKKFKLSDDGNGGADISGYEPADGDTGIDIPDQINGVAITGIAEDAFKDCGQVESINISGNISSISGNPFKYCSKLKQITVDPDNSTYDSRDNCNAVIEKSSNKLVAGISGTVIPDSVEIIGESAFEGCTDISSITIPDSVTDIEKAAFKDCRNLTGIQLPETLKSVGEEAFMGCENIKSVSVPDSVESIGDRAFGYADDNTVYSDFIMTCGRDSAARRYADNNNITVKTEDETEKPTERPTQESTEEPTEKPTQESTEEPTERPTQESTEEPTEKPTQESTEEPTERPTQESTEEPTEKPVQKDMSAATVTLKKAKTAYNGTAQNPEVVSVVLEAYTLAAGTDYEVEAVTAKTPGTYTVKVNGTGNYKGTATAEYTITKRDISKAAATVKAKTYTGKKLTSSGYTVKMKLNGKTTTLKKGTDYTVKAASRTSVGSSTVTITGKGNFKGTLKAEFAVTAKKISATKVTVPSEAVYTGKTVKVKVVVKDGSKKLDSRSYKVSYRNNRKIGKATVIITGKGNYTGTVRKTFRIVPNIKKQ